MQDRRTETRYSFPLDRRVAIQQSDGSRVPARASDISRHGIGVKCEYAADLGREFLLHFQLPVDGVPQPVSVRAQVMFCHLSGADDLFRIGMRFRQFNGDSEAVVEAYIAHRNLASTGRRS